MGKRFLYLMLAIVLLLSCRDERVIEDPTQYLTFSRDTICFDTVFTDIGSSTLKLKVYNPHKNAVKIQGVRCAKGRYFHINIDGENDLSLLQDMILRGGDSLFVFIRVQVDPTKENSPVLIEDSLCFRLHDKEQYVRLEAYGQDVNLIRSSQRITAMKNAHMTADKPWLIYDTLWLSGQTTIDEGCRLYLHAGAIIVIEGGLKAEGTLDKPICIQGDRLDHLFDSVPYSYASGTWGGIYIQPKIMGNYSLRHVEILSGTTGLSILGNAAHPATLKMDACRIHNHAQYGLILSNTNAEISNTEISNCANYCVYSSGGKQRFIHTTIASYFNATNIRIQSVGRDEVAGLYVDNLDKSGLKTEVSLINCVLMGIGSQQLSMATPLPQYYSGTITGCYIKGDSLTIPHASNNHYWTEKDTAIFVNDFYSYKDYRYYDFQLAEKSVLIGIADSLEAQAYPTDRLGNSRLGLKPDAGCYQRVQ